MIIGGKSQIIGAKNRKKLLLLIENCFFATVTYLRVIFTLSGK
jgi:hypothetical protein